MMVPTLGAGRIQNAESLHSRQESELATAPNWVEAQTDPDQQGLLTHALPPLYNQRHILTDTFENASPLPNTAKPPLEPVPQHQTPHMGASLPPILLAQLQVSEDILVVCEVLPGTWPIPEAVGADCLAQQIDLRLQGSEAESLWLFGSFLYRVLSEPWCLLLATTISRLLDS